MNDEINRATQSQTQAKSQTQTQSVNLISTDNVRYDKAAIKPLPTKVYYGVEYPANVQNPDRAIQLVGGVSKITNVFKSREKKYLQLKFRPNNPSCKPAFGTKSPTCHLLLRIRPTPPPQQDNDEFPVPLMSPTSSQPAQSQTPQFESTIIGLVPSTIKFDGLFDFQYLTQDTVFGKKNTTTNTTEPSTEDNEGTTTVKATTTTTTTNTNNSRPKKIQYYVPQYNDNTEITKDEPMNLIPPLFSRIDYPQNYLFKSNPNSNFDPTTNQFIISKQTLRKNATHTHFNTEIPVTPSEMPASILLNDLMQKTRRILESLFEKRPIWLAVPLMDQLQKEGGAIVHTRKLLPTVAFNFIDGPWRKCWVKLGYDPRIHPETALYQVIDFRINDHDSISTFNNKTTPNNSITEKNNNNNNNNNNNDNNNDNNNKNDDGIDSNGNNNSNALDDGKTVHKDEKLIIQAGDSNSEKVINPSRKKMPVINTFEFNASQKETNNLFAGPDYIPGENYMPPPYDFTFKTAPTTSNPLYQIIDLEEPSIQDYWHSQQIQSNCIKRFGWFTESSFKQGIDRMKDKYGIINRRMRFSSKYNIDISGNNNSLKAKSITNTNADGTTTTTTTTTKKRNIKSKKSNSATTATLSQNSNNENSQDKMEEDDEDKEIDDLLKRDTLAQMEKDNEYLYGRKDEIEIELDNNSNIVGGFGEFSDDEDKPFELLDDFDGTDKLQLKQIDDLFGFATNEDDEDEEDDEEEEEDEEEDDEDEQNEDDSDD